MERQAEVYFKRIEELGGVIPAIEASFFQKEIADSAFRYQQELEQKRRIMIGVNDFTVDEEVPIEILRIDPRLEAEQVARVREVRRKRDQARCSKALSSLKKAAAGSDNLMPYILEAVRAYATEGEIMNSLIEVFGIYTEQAVV
jgi:methylmalonyl-CoA mutase N-terminal domain/subunit